MVRSLQDSPDGVTAINEDGSAGDKIGSSGRQKDSGAGKFVGTTPAASRSDLVVDGQDYYIEIADNVQLSVASTCQLGGSAGSVVTWRSDLIGWFDAPAHALRFGSF
jgi:hypothetical protein